MFYTPDYALLFPTNSCCFSTNSGHFSNKLVLIYIMFIIMIIKYLIIFLFTHLNFAVYI